MFIDARNIPTDEVIETDVCIIGSGPAGTTLARELIGQDFRVCLLESGGTEADEKTQALCAGQITEELSQDLRQARSRQLGGTANLWQDRTGEKHYSVRLLPLDPIDFEQRDWLPYSGWPFDKSYLDPFYERAQHLCRLRPFAYDASDWENTQKPPLPFASNQITTTLYQFGPRDVFTHEFLAEIRRAANITTYFHANVVEIESNAAAKTATRARVACLQGNQFWVAARLFILATGGIENARLLLLSDGTRSVGLGNQNDLVGRFFMEHPVLRLGEFIPNNRQLFNSAALYDLHWANNILVMGKLSLSEEVMQRRQLLNSCMVLVPRPKGYGSAAVASFKHLLSSIHRLKVPKDTLKHLTSTIASFDEVASYYLGRGILKRQEFFYSMSKGGWSRCRDNHRKFRSFEVVVATEQAPNPEIRIVLNSERDALGLRKIQPLCWRWSNVEIHSILQTQEILTQEIARSKLGQFRSWIGSELETLPLCSGGNHHMGTTRMHVDPKQGVVDENCRVHGISNLYIAGSSVFPTGGYANPTLTIVALALRLADHVKTQMTSAAATAVLAQTLPL